MAERATYFHVLSKPSGATCNLDCKYCFFLSKEKLYPDSRFRMSEETLEQYLRQYLASQTGPTATIAWQGGEPTLMGLDFYRRAVELDQRLRRPGQQVERTLQTNGVLLDDAWCDFFREHDFLIGLSIDGPRAMHDAYRVDKGGRPTFDKVWHAVELLHRHGVRFNTLTTVHAANADHPLEVYRFLRDEVRSRFLQLIPIVERANDTGFQEGDQVTERSVKAGQYGRFLNTIFDEWVRRDVGTVFVQPFDAALASWVGAPQSLCIFAETCGDALALEHNGDLYSCDHFVEPNFLLGNIHERPMGELVASPPQRKFGQDKKATLPRYCRECPVKFACNGGCPKDRFRHTPDGEPGLNYLCAGYKAFFTHVDRPMRMMAGLLRRGRYADEVMPLLAAEDGRLREALGRTGPNQPCPCASGRKRKLCPHPETPAHLQPS